MYSLSSDDHFKRLLFNCLQQPIYFEIKFSTNHWILPGKVRHQLWDEASLKPEQKRYRDQTGLWCAAETETPDSVWWEDRDPARNPLALTSGARRTYRHTHMKVRSSAMTLTIGLKRLCTRGAMVSWGKSCLRKNEPSVWNETFSALTSYCRECCQKKRVSDGMKRR